MAEVSLGQRTTALDTIMLVPNRPPLGNRGPPAMNETLLLQDRQTYTNDRTRV